MHQWYIYDPFSLYCTKYIFITTQIECMKVFAVKANCQSSYGVIKLNIMVNGGAVVKTKEIFKIEITVSIIYIHENVNPVHIYTHYISEPDT